MLKLEEFLKEDILRTHFNETEKKVFRLVRKWADGDESFTFHTSGSTGKPKEIKVHRKKIEYSTNATFSAIDPAGKIKSSLLCIDPQFIGGAMVVLRSLIKNHNLYIIEPTSMILSALPSDFRTDLVSIVPAQFNVIDRQELKRFRNILIGGAPIEIIRTKFESDIYSTYGMTETLSHIALRSIEDEHFITTGDAKVRVSNQGCLEFKGTITDHEWLSTNDIGEVISPTSFKWIGRRDFIINSGGIKLNPELIEQKLAREIKSDFMITSLPDEKFGEKVVLVIEGDPTGPISFSNLDKYEVPKMIFSGVTLCKTSSGKLDRIQTKKDLISRL